MGHGFHGYVSHNQRAVQHFPALLNRSSHVATELMALEVSSKDRKSPQLRPATRCCTPYRGILTMEPMEVKRKKTMEFQSKTCHLKLCKINV